MFPRWQCRRLVVWISSKSAEGRLYYRLWNSPEVEAADEVPQDGRVILFPGSGGPTTCYIESRSSQDRPQAVLIQELPYASKMSAQQKTPQVRLRLTVDGRRESFWLEQLGFAQSVRGLPPESRQAVEKVVESDRRRVAATMALYSVDLGFDVYLREFERGLDPGTSMPSKYSSLVDLYARDQRSQDREDDLRNRTDFTGREKLQELRINLNEPKDVKDPWTGKSYRLFQASFNGPWKPGDAVFDELVSPGSPRDQLFMSSLSVNYDPGRGLKYAGCLLIVSGVIVIFYMRAYFFKRRTKTVGWVERSEPHQ